MPRPWSITPWKKVWPAGYPVNNAGISAVAEAETMSSVQWQSVIDTNLTGLFYCAQSAARPMLRAGSGKIINIASMYGISASSCISQASYVASKAGVLGLTRELAVEWAPRGLNVVALAPGFFRSDQTVWAFEEDKELGKKLLAKVPMARMGKLEELEVTIVYLASAGIRLYERPGPHTRRRLPFLVSGRAAKNKCSALWSAESASSPGQRNL